MNLEWTARDAFEFFRARAAEGGFRFATVKERTGLAHLSSPVNNNWSCVNWLEIAKRRAVRGRRDRLDYVRPSVKPRLPWTVGWRQQASGPQSKCELQWSSPMHSKCDSNRLQNRNRDQRVSSFTRLDKPGWLNLSNRAAKSVEDMLPHWDTTEARRSLNNGCCNTLRHLDLSPKNARNREFLLRCLTRHLRGRWSQRISSRREENAWWPNKNQRNTSIDERRKIVFIYIVLHLRTEEQMFAGDESREKISYWWLRSM